MTALAHAFVRPLIAEQCAAVREAAARVVRSAEEGQGDAEAVHDYRVALRRLRTLLDASEPLFKRGELGRVREGLKRFAQAAGAVRDEEVLAETVGALELPKETQGRVQAWLLVRARKERALRARVVRQLAHEDAGGASGAGGAGDVNGVSGVSGGGDVNGVNGASGANGGGEASGVGAATGAKSGAGPRPDAGVSEAEGASGAAPTLHGLLDSAETLPLRRKAASISTRALAMEAVRAAADRTLREAARPGAGTPERMHKLRIRWKGVRYTGELFSKAIARSGALAEALALRVKAATRMQKRLGDLHDLDEAIARVSRARVLHPGDRMVVHHGLRTARAALLSRLEKELPAALSLLDAEGGAPAAGT